MMRCDNRDIRYHVHLHRFVCLPYDTYTHAPHNNATQTGSVMRVVLLVHSKLHLCRVLFNNLLREEKLLDVHSPHNIMPTSF
jgi:hypothetical protein